MKDNLSARRTFAWLVLDALNIEEDLKFADVVIIGEGRLDFVVFPILCAPMTLADAMNKKIAAENIAATVKQVVRLLEKIF